MSTPAERRAELIEGMSAHVYGDREGSPVAARNRAEPYLDRLLKHFEDTDQGWIADAIRFGGSPVTEEDPIVVSHDTEDGSCRIFNVDHLARINYPETD